MDFEETSRNLDYYGIVSIISKEIGLASIIDEFTGTHYNQKVSCGQATLAMILNMLAIFMRPLYLTSEFFEDKPIDRLIDSKLTAKNFNDDVLGRTLDKLYECGLESIFMRVAASALSKYQEFCSPFLHGDTTSMSVYGEYDHNDYEIPITITHGYSKDGRKDLKQFIISLVTCDRLPVFLSTLSGNTSDKVYFRKLIKEYGSQMQEIFDEEKTFVFDAAFYSEPSIQACSSDFTWITRVPENILEAKDLLLSERKLKSTSLSGYLLYSTNSDYGGIEQRWILVYSSKAYKKEKKNLYKTIEKKKMEIENEVWHFSNKLFGSKEDAEKSTHKMANKWKFHEIKDLRLEIKEKKKIKRRGRPKKNEEMQEYYRIFVEFEESELKIKNALKKKGRFIVATNILDKSKLSDEECLVAYKDQQKVERGFRFLKDPMFFVDGIYLEKISRIMAMSMIMGLALLIYSLMEKKLRKAFRDADEVFLDRHCKQTNNPTIRRVFQVFMGIHIHYIKMGGETVNETILNLMDEHKQVLRLLGDEYQKMYENRGKKVKIIIENDEWLMKFWNL